MVLVEETVGQRLRRLRLERGLSQHEIASPGVSETYISRIEAESRRPSVTALRKLASKLDVSAEYLEHGEDNTTTDLLLLELVERSEAAVELRVWPKLVEVAFDAPGLQDCRQCVSDWPLTAALRGALARLDEVSAALRGALAQLDEVSRLRQERDRIEEQLRELEVAAS